MASPANKTAQEREDTDYDPGTSGSEAGTPKKGRKKKETPDPGLTLGTDIKDHLKLDGRQVEVELDNVRIDQEKTKGQIRRKDTELGRSVLSHWKQHRQQAHYTSFSGKIIVCCQRTVRSSRCASPRAWACLIFADGDYWCVSGQQSVEAIAKILEKRRTACLDLQHWHTTCIAAILKPETAWVFRAKLAGQAQGSTQDVEPIPLYEAADNLIRCVEDQRRRGLLDTYSNLKIAIVDAVQMSALLPTAELKQPGQFVCSLIVVWMLFVARGLAHNLVIFRTKRINCGRIS